MKIKLANDYSKDLVLVCGDLNVHRYKISDYYLKQLFISSASWVDYFEIFENEYEHLLTSLKDANYNVVNIWDRDNSCSKHKCVTFGDVIKPENEENDPIPKENVLT